MDVFSHDPLGSIVFCLPVGGLAVLLFYALRGPVVRLLSDPYQRALLPLCHAPRASLVVVLASLLVGTWTHLFWDSCTHTDGWWVQHIPGLADPVFRVGYHTARVCLLLWYASSFAGMIWLLLAFEKWKQARVAGHARVSGGAVWRDAVLVAVLLLPIGLVHHLLRRSEAMLYVVGALCALPAIAIFLKLRKARNDPEHDTA
jgi:hypothetical protein